MHTIISRSSLTLDDLKRVMIRIQISALETLERCMADPKPSDDEKPDKAEAAKLNRQRMSATQTLLHCRTMFRELREAELQEHRIAEEKHQNEKKTIFGLPTLDRPYRTNPDPYDVPDAPGGSAKGGIPMPRTSGCAAGPSSQPSPAHFNAGREGAKAEPLSLGAVVGAEGAGHASAARPPKPDSANRTRFKTRKPKHPRQSRKRKRKQSR